MNAKDGLSSVTFWGGFLSYIVTIAAAFGVTLHLGPLAPVFAGAASLAITIYGRVRATKSIDSFLGLTTKTAATKAIDAAKSTGTGA